MFTSRAVVRLSLIGDNADERLTEMGMNLGVVGPARAHQFLQLKARLSNAREILRGQLMLTTELAERGIAVEGENSRRSAFQWLGLGSISLSELASNWPQLEDIEVGLYSRLEADAKYDVYLSRQKKDIERQRADESIEIPHDFDYHGVSGLSNELK